MRNIYSIGISALISQALSERLRFIDIPSMPSRGATKRRNKTTIWRPNGKREVARRLRQIAAGQLTVSNGLVK